MTGATRIGVTGHRSLNERTRRQIAGQLRARLQDLDAPALTGISCLAPGADQLFAETVLELGGGLEVVLPARRYRDVLPAAASAAFDALLGRACRVACLPFERPTPRAYRAAGRAVVEGSDVLLAVWDGLPPRGVGGTGEVVAYAHDLSVPVEIVWPEGARRR
jgi:hypothetical protein